MDEKRSPLKSKPLRNPGQSLDEEIERLFLEDAVPYIMVIVMVIMLMALSWAWYLLETQPNPIVITVIAAVVVAISVVRIVRLRERFQQLKLGRDGERAVGQYLELLRESGCRVFHDIVGDGFNIDHVVLSQRGIFTIETKTYSRPAKGNPKIKYDGRKVLVNGFEPDKDIVGRAAAQRNWLCDLLEESTGKRLPVRGVVVIPGW